MYRDMHPKIQNKITSGIVCTNQLGKWIQNTKINKNMLIDEIIIREFEECLKKILTEILDTDTPFSHLQNKDCYYCNL